MLRNNRDKASAVGVEWVLHAGLVFACIVYRVLSSVLFTMVSLE